MATATKELTKELTDVRDMITAHLLSDDRSLKWLSKKTGINYNTMYSIFTQKITRLSADKLENINSVLGTSFKA